MGSRAGQAVGDWGAVLQLLHPTAAQLTSRQEGVEQGSAVPDRQNGDGGSRQSDIPLECADLRGWGHAGCGGQPWRALALGHFP